MFKILSQNNLTRRGQIETPHGKIETPCFMPIATKGAVKTLTARELTDAGAQIILANAYHLLLRPGLDAMRAHGGLHNLMRWNSPILTDSGGYQVYSLGALRKVSEQGVRFNSYIDGSHLDLTPELSIDMQMAIGSDIIMQFDDVVGPDVSEEKCGQAMERSLRWANRCKDRFDEMSARAESSKQMLFGIVQGGTYEDLRERSARGLMNIGFDGYAIGGLSVGEAREDAYRIAEYVCGILPEDKPRYFMGSGMPEEIVKYTSMGVDMFDCVLPTRNARHGTLFVWSEDPSKIDFSGKGQFYKQLRISNEEYRFDTSMIDPYCDCAACEITSRAYLRHLFSVGEMLAMRLATIHNVRFYLRLMEELRKKV